MQQKLVLNTNLIYHLIHNLGKDYFFLTIFFSNFSLPVNILLILFLSKLLFKLFFPSITPFHANLTKSNFIYSIPKARKPKPMKIFLPASSQIPVSGTPSVVQPAFIVATAEKESPSVGVATTVLLYIPKLSLGIRSWYVYDLD